MNLTLHTIHSQNINTQQIGILTGAMMLEDRETLGAKNYVDPTVNDDINQTN